MISQDLIKINISYLAIENNKIIKRMKDNVALIAPNIDPSLAWNVDAQLSFTNVLGKEVTAVEADVAKAVIKENKALRARLKENLLEVKLYLEQIDTFDI